MAGFADLRLHWTPWVLIPGPLSVKSGEP
jgi:hypothetical protein